MTQSSRANGAPPPEDAGPEKDAEPAPGLAASPPVRSGAAVIPMTDRVLLERHANGDAEAFNRLVQTYAKPIYGYLTGSGIPAHERDDLFQEIFVKVHRAAGRAMPSGPVRPWLLTIAVNTVRDHARRGKVRSIVSTDSGASADTADRSPSGDPGAVLAARETASFLATQIGQLPLAQREALMLCSVQGLSVKEAAAILEAPPNTVKTRLRRARTTLAEAVQRRQRVSDREVSS